MAKRKPRAEPQSAPKEVTLPTNYPAPMTGMWDITNPTAIINMVPPTVAQCFLTAYQTKPDIFSMDEVNLLETLENKPTSVDNCIRLGFWKEYDMAQYEDRKMQIRSVIAGICTAQYFYTRYLKKIDLVAWLLTPPMNYEMQTTEALAFGLHQLRDILSQPHVKDGQIDTKMAGAKFRIVQMLDNRVKGAPMQKFVGKIHDETRRAHTKAANNLREVSEMNTMEEIEQRLQKIETQEFENRAILHKAARPVRSLSGDGETVAVEKGKTPSS